MSFVAQILVALVALLHFGFLVMEMFLWDEKVGHKIFGMRGDFAAKTRTMAANQGLSNGFVAAGLVWSLFPVGAPNAAVAIVIFFLSSIIIAGIFGAATVSRLIFWVQAAPAIVALAAVWAA